MGNSVTRVSHCFAINGEISRRHDIAVYIEDPLSQEPLGLGHSFCYIRPEPTAGRRPSNASNKIHSDETTPSTTTSFFRSISGASVSANTSTPPSTSLLDSCPHSSGLDMASSAFESSDSFTSIPLQPVPRGTGRGALSGPIERGFLSGPIEKGFLSGPIDRGSYYSSASGPVEKEKQRETVIENSNSNQLKRSFSQGGGSGGLEMEQIITIPKKRGLMKALKKALSKTISRSFKAGVKETAPVSGDLSGKVTSSGSNEVGGEEDEEEEREGEYSDFSIGGSQNLQWAQGKAGEDRMHIIVSEDKGWVFVGIYDGFNGPDAPDYLLSNLYSNVHKELEGLLWDDGFEREFNSGEETGEDGVSGFVGKENWDELGNGDVESGAKGGRGKGLRYKSSKGARRRNRWSCEWDRERVELDWKLKEKLNREGGSDGGKLANHSHVLKALSEALKKTEEEYFEMADTMAGDNPELALMGSCVLVMLMKGEDVYLMNVGDSRAVLAQSGDTDLGGLSQNLKMIHEERLRDVEVLGDGDEFCTLGNLRSLQLTMDHSTYVDKEVERIKREHPDDASAIMNDRVKGYLKVTRAFGVGFLKQPKWNDQLLEMFRIDYIGTSPYITCSPFLYHHRLTSRDRFLILSSDGLYQYFTNEEVVGEVESFISAYPEGDPAQHLIEEVLFRAAKKAGMDFHELLDVPQGDRRRYHDDVSVIIISLEGRIWRSSV